MDLSDENFGKECCSKYLDSLRLQKQFDNSFESEGGLVVAPEGVEIRRLIYSPVGRINRDYDDIRRFSEAALKGIKKALKSGAKRPLVCLPTGIKFVTENYSWFDVSTVLGAYEAVYMVRQ